MDKPKFEFYVLNYDFNKQKVIMFNIFDNTDVYDLTLKEVKKYCHSPKKYTYYRFMYDGSEKHVYGFEGFCENLSSIIRYQEWSRREYEISVGNAFETDIDKYEKWDCYQQADPNIEIIAREVIYQYRQWIKENK